MHYLILITLRIDADVACEDYHSTNTIVTNLSTSSPTRPFYEEVLDLSSCEPLEMWGQVNSLEIRDII